MSELKESHNHKPGEHCRACEIGMDAFLAEEAETIKKYGFVVRAIQNDPLSPFGINYTTYGIKENFNHLDLQMCFPIRREIAHAIFIAIFEEIKNGKKFEAGIDYDDILAGDYKMRFINAREMGRPVLRALVCDVNGEYKGKFAKQFEMMNNDISELN